MANASVTITITTEPGPDTFPQWLYNRIGVSTWKSDDPSRGWDGLSEESRAYWFHEAAAIRRAVARNGFKKAVDR